LHSFMDIIIILDLPPGTLKSFLSGRISYAMQLGGPSVVVDTACSSSLVAIYQGVRALLASDCDAAIVGGVNIISSPDVSITSFLYSQHSTCHFSYSLDSTGATS
jgi:acyl transferase domain-containing protein